MKRSIATWLLIVLVTIGMLGTNLGVFAQTPQGGGTTDLSNSRICPKCGAINPKDSKFCKDCGYSFSAAMQLTQPIAQPVAQPKGPKKEPALSWALSFFLLPGIGQFYNGDGGKGIAQLLIYGGATVLWIANIPGTTYTTQSYYDPYYGYQYEIVPKHTGNTALFWTGLGIAAGDAIWSWIDAPVSASRKNKENGYSFRNPPQLHFTLTPDPRSPQKLQPGLALKKSF
jgi:hypothetical protein